MPCVRRVCSCGGPKDFYATRCQSCRNALRSVDGRVPRRIWQRVDPVGTCWIWRGSLWAGYAVAWIEGKTRSLGPWLFRQMVADYDTALHLDHLCRVPACINPTHREPVTPRENQMRAPESITAINARRTHCTHGHPFSVENTYVDHKGHRYCRACHRLRQFKRNRARRAA